MSFDRQFYQNPSPSFRRTKTEEIAILRGEQTYQNPSPSFRRTKTVLRFFVDVLGVDQNPSPSFRRTKTLDTPATLQIAYLSKSLSKF